MAHNPLLAPARQGTPRKEARRTALANARLYLCTDARADHGDLREFLHAAYEGGVDIIQLRDKTIDTRSEITAVETLADVAAEHSRLFAVNDRADIAALVDADILHVGQEDLTTAHVRRLLGDDILVGRSNRNAAMFAESMADPGIDYAVIGPVWATPTKPDRAAVGLDMVAAAATIATPHPAKPWWAIGGIDTSRISDVTAAGAQRIVVVRALTDAADPETAARQLRRAITEQTAQTEQ